MEKGQECFRVMIHEKDLIGIVLAILDKESQLDFLLLLTVQLLKILAVELYMHILLENTGKVSRKGNCCKMNCVPPNLYVESPIL